MIAKFAPLFSAPVFDASQDNTLGYEELFTLKQKRVAAEKNSCAPLVSIC